MFIWLPSVTTSVRPYSGCVRISLPKNILHLDLTCRTYKQLSEKSSYFRTYLNSTNFFLPYSRLQPYGPISQKTDSSLSRTRDYLSLLPRPQDLISPVDVSSISPLSSPDSYFKELKVHPIKSELYNLFPLYTD